MSAETVNRRKLRRDDGTMRFGLFWPYSQTLIPSTEIARRNPDVMDLDNHIRLARAIETVGMDFGLIADGYAPASEANSRIGFQDPSTNAIVWAVPLMQATTHLGFMSTIHSSFLHPVVIARLGAHLDFISGGRWGWNIVNGFREHEAKLFGLDSLDHDGGYDQADEAVQVIKALWTQPPEGIDHVGPRFKVKGRIRKPLPETLPVLVSAASSERGRAFATKHCDYLFASPHTAEDIIELQQSLTRQAQAIGRADVPKILVLADIIVRAAPGAAKRELQDLLGSIDAEANKAWTTHLAKVAHQGRRPGDILGLAGTANEVADQIIVLHRESKVTGFALRQPLWAAEEALTLAPVFAQLEKAGIWLPPQKRDYSW
jgi:FMNH2-dependent dimethyl sulfone monooxygenase